MNIEEIQNRFERGYTMALYGTRENIHEQMTNDIEKLLEAINFTDSSMELKEKEVMNFKEWAKTFEYKETYKGNFVKRGIEYSKESVHSLYYTEYRNHLIT